MNAETVETLCKLNNDFYRNHADSFSATRKSPWSGWERCLDIVRGDCLLDPTRVSDSPTLSVFDLACGNLRFEAFLASALEPARIVFYAVDNCDSLVPNTLSVNYQTLDILAVLRDGLCINDKLEAPVCDLSVSFGFMHHVPLEEYREEVLRSLIRQTRSGGYVMVSFWQFCKNAEMAEKAQVTNARALEELGLPELDSGDYLLGWKNMPGEYRYCHNFSEPEIDVLVASVAELASEVSRFEADGRTGNLNTYLILKVR
ncbi:MAG: class I SAM-dependent methyltransferase [Actinobacteria bacterium]|nr:class I SAM-dependent methyltransferase [Actinomycetota bacterium]